MKKKYCVPIVYVGLSNFIVEGDSWEDAVSKATDEFNNGGTPELLGNEYERVERVGTVEEVT